MTFTIFDESQSAKISLTSLPGQVENELWRHQAVVFLVSIDFISES